MKIRPITEKDKKEVLKISSRIWEGDDYIHLVFDEWISDKSGKFVGLWENDILLGFGKLTYLTPFDVWLEGLRKNHEIKQKGVGEKLAKYFLNELKSDKRLKSIRFSTYFGNLPSIKLNEKLGFRKVQTCSLKYLEIEKKNNIQNQELVFRPTFDSILNYIKNSDYLKKMNFFYPKGWVFYPFWEKIIEDAFENNRIFCCGQNEKIKGIIILEPTHYEGIQWISFWETENFPAFKFLLEMAKNKAFRNGKRELQLLLPKNSNLQNYCRQTGFQSWEREDDVFLYEFPPQNLITFSTD
ncbi:MAG: hypothetical protein DRZ79_00735 [Candidatus Cloacimonadota bacterium]|nr:MAG: hypothetical protein DRZ79_00735 [Candidatus Cloacimonadota bacterium]